MQTKDLPHWRNAKKLILHSVAGLLLSLQQMFYTVNPIDIFVNVAVLIT